jgi:integrase
MNEPAQQKLLKKRFRLFQRANGVFYIENNETGEQRSLKTRQKMVAEEFLNRENQRYDALWVQLELGKVYIRNADPVAARRTWQSVMDEFQQAGAESTRKRYERAWQEKAFDIIRTKPLVDTNADDFNAVIKRGGVSANHFLRRLHNLATENQWLWRNIIAPKKWPAPEKKQKRAITAHEHKKILDAEQHQERRAYYEMLWLTGAAQGDCAKFSADNINQQKRVLSYQRQKTKQWAHLQIGKSLDELLSRLPKSGLLFPHVATLKVSDRSAEFYRRCKNLGIKGVSLHSYRYSFAERAYASGYNERFAQAALGHKSRAVHHHYSKGAEVICPPLENVIPFNQPAEPQAFLASNG